MKALHRQRAFALVLVLIVIVLTATMAVFFLASAGQERRGVDLYGRGSQTRHLAGMAVSRVIGQIGSATKEATAADPVAWASQPGMIRTYGQDGNPRNIYKLYSWESDLAQTGVGYTPLGTSEVPPSGWKDSPQVFTDLNHPINGLYPIVDPAAENAVEGFSIDKTNAAVSGSGSEAPMPVKWLYVLEDGQMVAGSSPSGSTVTVAGASTANPVVGRVAFWTDDETSKVNINTASEGVFWDVPRSGSRDDVQFAGNPPVNYEFQRTPGHPSMTSLSAVFPELLTEAALDPTQTRWGSDFVAEVQKLYAMSPRIAWGAAGEGSQGGRFPITSYSFNYGPARDAIPLSTLPKKITLDSDRLYVSADDFWFKPDRAANEAFAGKLTAADFQKRLFFLTASSRAPETTLFETPRVSLWPITWPNVSSYFVTRNAIGGLPAKYKSPTPQNPETTKLADINPVWITAQERLLAFCASLNTQNANGGDRYFFQRKDPDSPVNDWDNIPRNQVLVNYLIRQMREEVPGYGSSLQSGLGGSAPTTAWIAFNAFDYVRSFVNQYTAPDAQEGIRYSFAGVSFRNGRMGGVSMNALNEPNAKTPTPLRANIEGVEQRGIGTLPVLEEAALAFYAVERNEPVPPVLPPGITDPEDPAYPEWRDPYNWTNLINLDATNGYPVGAQTTKMRAVMLLDFTGLEPGVSIKPTFWVKVKGDSFRVNGNPIGFPSASGFTAQVTLSTAVTTSPSVTPLYKKDGRPKIFSNSETGATVWQLVSNDIPVNAGALNFQFIGSPTTIEIYACDPTNIDTDPTNNPARKIAEKTVDFSQWDSPSLPMPMAPRWGMSSRAYRFDNAGTLIPGQTGQLPGSSRSKTAAPTAKDNMAKFSRVAVGDAWQPNPTYQNFPGAAHPNTTWAWAEYASSITAPTDAMPDIRSASTIAQYRQNSTTYAYRTSLAGWTRDTNDPDEARESGDSLRNLSTNFRKRVGAVNQRNSVLPPRAAFCVEGHTAQAPVDFNDPNAVSGSSGPTFDLFVQTTDGRLYDSLPLLTPYDTVLSMVNAPLSGTDDRDPRLSQLSSSNDFRRITTVLTGVNPATVIDPLFPRTTVRSQWHGFGTPGLFSNVTGYQSLPTFRTKKFARSGTYIPGAGGDLGGSGGIGGIVGAVVGARNKIPDAGDWTGMPGRYADGGLLTRPDQEYGQLTQDTSGGMYVPFWPRLGYGDYVGPVGAGSAFSADLSYFSPNRQIPSPVLLGTLPRSLTTGWQTLAFSPNPAAKAGHPGLRSPTNGAPDHLLLDLFWMPVVEPYPISDQLSTAGKVNLNYRMMPFSYLKRQTALYAAMKSTWITALTDNDNNFANHKSHLLFRDQAGSKTRYSINVDETLKGFEAVFDAGDLMRSASQICEMFLVPQGTTLADASDTYWDSHRLTADNAREQPYDHLYSRVTTKSNTYTVHWRVQTLRKVPGTTANVWEENRDRVAAELRGSTLIERYIDPNAINIPDYASDTTAEPLGGFYQWRVVSENYFQP